MDLGEVDWIDLGEQRVQIFLVIIHDKEQIIKSFQVCLAANRQDYVEQPDGVSICVHFCEFMHDLHLAK